MISAEQLLAAIQQADSEAHPSDQAWIDDELGLVEVTLDGHFNLVRVAELLSGTKNERENSVKTGSESGGNA